MTIRVELDMFNLCKLRNEDLMQFAVRQTLRSALPVASTSGTPSTGTLREDG